MREIDFQPVQRCDSTKKCLRIDTDSNCNMDNIGQWDDHLCDFETYACKNMPSSAETEKVYFYVPS